MMAWLEPMVIVGGDSLAARDVHLALVFVYWRPPSYGSTNLGDSQATGLELGE